MCNVLNILDILGVKGLQRVYLNLKNTLTKMEAASSTYVMLTYCEHPFDVYFRLSADESAVYTCNEKNKDFGGKYYTFRIQLSGIRDDTTYHWRTMMELFTGNTLLFEEDITDYLNNDKRNPYLKLYTTDAAIYGNAEDYSDNQQIVVVKGIVGSTEYVLPGLLYFNNESKAIATEATQFLWSQYDITITETLYMRWGDAKKIITI